MAIQNIFARGVATLGQLAGWKDYGISEKISGSQAQTQPYLYGSSGGAWVDPNYGRQTSTQQVYHPSTKVSNLPTSQYGGGSSGGQTLGVNTGGGQPDSNQYMVNQPAGVSMEDIDRAYQEAMGVYSGMEEQARTGAELEKREIGTGAEEALSTFNLRRGEEEAKLTAGRTSAQQAEKSQISKARGLYNELRQTEMARLSAMGLTSSSVAEAGFEKIGRTTAGVMGGARQEATNVLNQISGEERRIGQWFTEQTTTMEKQKQLAIDQATQRLQSTLTQIGGMKAQASQDKAQMRYEALQDFRDENIQIQQINNNMGLALEQWAFQKQQAIESAKAQVAKVASFNYEPNYAELQARFPNLQAQTASWNPQGGGYWEVGYQQPEEEDNNPIDYTKLNY